MMDGDKAWVWALSSANEWRREAITTPGHVALERVGGYLRGTAVIAAFDGLFEGLFLLILGVPHALPLAVIVFFGRFIPYIGGLVTTILLLSVTLATQGTTGGAHPARPDHDPECDPGQVPGPGHLQQDRPHPPGDRAHRAAGRGSPGRDRRALRGDPRRRLRPRHHGRGRSRSWVSIRRRARPPTRSSPSGWIGSASGAGDCWCRSALLGVVIVAAVQVPIVVLPLVLGIVLASTLLPLVQAPRGSRLEQGPCGARRDPRGDRSASS